MSTTDKTRTIVGARAIGPASLSLTWSDGFEVDLDLSDALKTSAFAALRDASEFAKVQLGDWGHSLEWIGTPFDFGWNGRRVRKSAPIPSGWKPCP